MTASNEADNEVDNHRRWDGHTPGRYEIWYLTFNDPATGDGFWIRYTLEAPADGREPYAQLWFARFAAADAGAARPTFGINRKLPIATMTASTQPFAVTIGASKLGHDHARGALSGAGHDAEWDLAWTPNARTMFWLPSVMYGGGGRGDATVLSPSPDLALRGTITVDGHRYQLDGAPGGQTHLWGKKHTPRAWGHCNAFDGAPGFALEVLAPRLKVRGVELPWLTLATLRTPDGDVAFNRFDQAILAPRPETGTGRFRFVATGLLARLEGTFTCATDRLVRADYVDPGGERAWCHNSCVADLTLTLSRRVRGRWRTERALRSDGRAHFELAGRAPDPAVTRLHTTID